MGDTLKLNNKGFAISSIMYIILVLAVILISLILVTLSSRKLILDKLREEVLTTINDAPNITYRQTIKELKNEAIAYMTDNSLPKESIKVEDLNSSVDSEVLSKYKLNDKYLTAVQNTDSYNVYLGKASTISNTTELPKNTIDVVDYKIYGESVQAILPNEYQQVEYIESDGNQYIDTGIYLTNEDEIKVEYMSTSANNYVVFGARNSANSKNIGAGLIDDYFYADFNNSSYDTYRMGYDGAIINQRLKYVLSKEGRYLYNGETLINSNTTLCNDEFTTDQTSYLFYGNGTQTSKAEILTGRIYSFMVYRSNSLIINMIPCYRKSDNVIGMYDIIEDKFYTNKGSGTFIKGSNAPTPEAPIEVESVGEYDETNGKYKMPVKTGGKNLFDKDNVARRISKATVIEENNDVIIIQGDEGLGELAYSAGEIRMEMHNSYEANKTYTLSIYMTLLEAGKWDRINEFWFGASKSDYAKTHKIFSGDQNSIIGIRQKYSFTFTPNYDLKTITIRLNGGKWNIEWNTLQLEQNNEVTEYEPYIEPVTTNIYLDEPLRRIGDYADYTDFKNQKVVRKTADIKLFGSFTKYNDRVWILKTGKNLFKTNNEKITHFRLVYDTSFGMRNMNQVNYYVEADRIEENMGITLDEFNSWIDENDVHYYAALNEKEDEPKELPRIQINEGVTQISIDTSIAPSSYEFTVIEKMIEI